MKSENKSEPDIKCSGELESRSNNAWEFASLGLLSVIAAIFRSVALVRKPFWFDEGISVEIARLDWHNFARILWAREGNMSLYYLLLRAWLLFGHSEAFIRALSVIFSVATLPPLYLLAKRLFDRRTALIAGILYAFNAYSVRYAQDARSYSLFLFLTTLSSLFFVACIKKPKRSLDISYVIATGLGIYAHFYTGLIMAAQWAAIHALGSGIRDHFRKNWRWIGFLSLPAIVSICRTGPGPILWIPRPGLSTLYHYLDHMSGNGGPGLVASYLIAIIAAVFPLRCFLLNAAPEWTVWRYQFLLLWLILPVLFTFAISLVLPLFLARYLIFCLPAYLILAAAGLRRLQSVWLLAPALLILIGLSLRGTLSYYDSDFELYRDDWRSATRYILENSHPGEVILFYNSKGRMPYEFYKSVSSNPTAAPEIIYPRHGEGVDYGDFVEEIPPGLLQSVCLRFPSVWVVLSHNLTQSSAPDATTQTLEELFSRSYVRVETHTFAGVEVRRYSRD